MLSTIFNHVNLKNLMAFNKKSDTSFPVLKETQAALRCGIVGHVPTGRSCGGHHGIPGTDRFIEDSKPPGWCECCESKLEICTPAMTYWRDFLVFWSDSLHILAASQSEVNYPKTKNRKLVVSAVPTHPTKTL